MCIRDRVITLKESDIYENIETPFCSDKGFDGWYLDEALTKPANGFVGKTSDIYVKWRKDAFKTVNTYDEKNVEYIEEADGNYTLLKRKINGKPADEKYFSQYNALVTENEFDKKSGNSVKITVAHGYTCLLYTSPHALTETLMKSKMNVRYSVNCLKKSAILR